jgi:hypothetical protein
MRSKIFSSLLRRVHSFWLFTAFYLFVLPIAYSQPGAPPPGPGGGAPPPPPPTVPDVTGLSAQTILVRLTESLPNLMRMVTAIAYVLGFVFVIRGIVKLKHVGESRTMMSQEHSLTQPIILIMIGSLLIYLPSSVHIGMSTFWTEPNPYGYIEQTDQWSQFINICFLVVQFIGTIAFIRGLVILSSLGHHSGQQNLSRGLTHIIGGIFCINIYQFVQVIMATLGIQT